MPNKPAEGARAISTSLPADLWDEVKEFADAADRPISRVLRQALREFLERQKHA